MGVETLPQPGRYDSLSDQYVALTNPALAALGISAGLSGYGAQRVTQEPSVLLTDPFDGAYDPQVWTTGGTVAPTVTGGRALVEPGTTASASSFIQSIPSFTPPGGTFLGIGNLNRFENIGAGLGTVGYLNQHRFFGFGLAPTTWVAAYSAGNTTSNPLLNAYGFEIDVDGNLYACVYDNGTRTRADAIGQAAGEKRLNLGRAIFNGELHQFTIVVRPDAIFWYIDGQDLPAAVLNYRSAGFPVPDKQTLPLRIHSINGTTAATGATVHRPSAVAVADTGSNNIVLADGTYGWKEASVTDTSVIPGALQRGVREQTVGSALNVNTNAIQLATYRAIAKPAAAALVAGTLSLRCSLHHLATSTRTVRIRRVIVSAMMSGVIEASQVEIHRITAAPTGTAVTGAAATASNTPADPRDAAPEAVFSNSLTAATSAGLLAAQFLAQSTAAALHGGGVVLYDWQESGGNKPLTLRAGVLEGIAVGIVSSAAVTPTLTIDIVYTEE